jgi:putative heme-binding domain-containing protein
VQGAALAALQPFQDKEIPETVLAVYPKLPADLRGKAQALLCSRPASALEFLKAVDAGRVNPKEVPLEQLQRVVQYKDEQIGRLVEKHWGKVGPATEGEKVSRIRSIAHILGMGKGDPANGKVLFQKTCATCHTLFGEGGKVGPDLTGGERKNRDFLITQIVDPNALVRPEFVAHTVLTTDGRSLTGLVVEATPQAVTLVDAKAERTVIARSKIDEFNPSAVSLMPEKLLDPFDDQQIRDLFSYLQSDGPGGGPAPMPPNGGK